jgi:BirA family biotin operon repressor/biotin-[acetyl-CoA-carboxylase] ligase
MGFSLTLKWPNDLLAQERYKAGGILLEEREGILMAGMGVNLAHVPPPEQLRRQAAVPAGLLADSGDNRRPPPPFVLWQHLVRAIIQEYTQAVSGHGLSDILTTFTPLLAWTHSRVTLIDGGGSRISGILEGLDAAGNLLLRLDTGEVSALCCGSLSLP